MKHKHTLFVCFKLRANLETLSLLFPISSYIPGFNPSIRSYFPPNQKFVGTIQQVIQMVVEALGKIMSLGYLALKELGGF